YLKYYHRVQECRCFNGLFEPGFELLTLLIATTGASPEIYLSVVAALLVLSVWSFLNNLCSLFEFNSVVAWKMRFAVLSIVLMSPFFFSGSVNVIRHGLSAFLVLNAAILVLRGQWFTAAMSGVLSVLIHRTAVLYLPFLPFVRSSRRYNELLP